MSAGQPADPNPYEASQAQASDPSAKEEASTTPGRATYNTVTDVVTGPNIRLRDNLIQAAVILLAIPLGAGIGYLMAPMEGWVEYVVLGAVGGLLIGLFGSGGFLMVYRAWCHARGKHD